MQSAILRDYCKNHGSGIFDGYYHDYGENAGKDEGIDAWEYSEKTNPTT